MDWDRGKARVEKQNKSGFKRYKLSIVFNQENFQDNMIIDRFYLLEDNKPRHTGKQIHKVKTKFKLQKPNGNKKKRQGNTDATTGN